MMRSLTSTLGTKQQQYHYQEYPGMCAFWYGICEGDGVTINIVSSMNGMVQSKRFSRIERTGSRASHSTRTKAIRVRALVLAHLLVIQVHTRGQVRVLARQVDLTHSYHFLGHKASIHLGPNLILGVDGYKYGYNRVASRHASAVVVP